MNDDMTYEEYVAVQAMDDALDELEGAGRIAEQTGQYLDKIERRLRSQMVLRRFMERRIHNLKVETVRLARAHQRQRARAEEAVSLLRVYYAQPGLAWDDVGQWLAEDGPF